mmetsp:Transcript_42466/g.92336  ORF Transcript_42466/g.92336 Transcript_42466/m.92336 type:complete len:218 (+) Transcript_42466:36-689(+)
MSNSANKLMNQVSEAVCGNQGIMILSPPLHLQRRWLELSAFNGGVILAVVGNRLVFNGCGRTRSRRQDEPSSDRKKDHCCCHQENPKYLKLVKDVQLIGANADLEKCLYRHAEGGICREDGSERGETTVVRDTGSNLDRGYGDKHLKYAVVQNQERIYDIGVGCLRHREQQPATQKRSPDRHCVPTALYVHGWNVRGSKHCGGSGLSSQLELRLVLG